MPISIAPRRVAKRFLVGLACAVLPLLGIKLNCPGPPLAPAPGLPQYQELAALAVPGGLVNVAGGNLIVSRTDLSLDTHLGTFTVGATYNSAAGNWLWSFDDIQYANGSFTDPTGAVHDVSELADAQAIPGTAWVKVGVFNPGTIFEVNVLKMKGGLQYLFSGDTGRPLAVHWTSSASPYLGFSGAVQGDGEYHTTSIEHCVAGGICSTIYEFEYDSSGRVVEITDRAGRIAEFGYDASGRLSTARDALDVVEGWPGFRYEYQDTRLTALTNSEGERIEFGYDGTSARVLQVRPIGEENPVHAFSYKGESGGLFSTIYTDPTGHQTTFRYDGTRRISSVKVVLDAQQGVSELKNFEWTGQRITRLTHPDGTSATLTYVDDDVASRTEPSGNVVTFTYEPNGVNRENPWSRPILAVVDSVGPIESRTYDAQGRLASITNGAGETTNFTYGASQMVATTTRPSGVVTTLSDHGEHGHPRAGSIGDFAFEFAYDAVGNLTQGPDFESPSGPGLGGIVSRSFNADRNVESVELVGLCLAITTCGDPSKNLTIERRSDGRPTLIERPYGGDSEFLYDDLGRLEEQREKATGVGHADWQSTSFGYDPLGRLTARTRPNGMSEFWGYDALGRVTEHSIHEDGVEESAAAYTYVNGRLVSVLDSTYGTAESYAYDSAGRIDIVTFPLGEKIDRVYDLRSRPIGSILVGPASQPFFRVLGFGYDGANRETVARDGDFTLLSRSFVDGRLASITYGNGLERTFDYDASTGFPAGSATRFDEATVEATSIEIDSPGLAQFYMTAFTQTFGAVAIETSENYILGPNQAFAGKRVGRWDSYGSTQQLPTRGYEYDELSNLEVGPLHDGVYNAEKNRLLRLAQIGSPGTTIHTYQYDEAGYAASRDGVSFDWDGAGRIRAIGSSVSFTWDTQGRLVSRTVDGIEQERRYGGLVEADAAGNLLAIDLGEVRIDLASGAYLYRHLDFRGNVKFTSDDQGNVAAHYLYEAYGVAAVYGTEGSIEENRNFAQGREYAGFQLLGTRLYDAEAGRFLSPDPIYQLINQYSYTLGNPIWFWDQGGTHPSFANGMTNYYFGMAQVVIGFGVTATTTATAPVNGWAVAGGVLLIANGFRMMAQGAAEMNAAADASGAGADTGVSQPSGQQDSPPGEGQSGHYYEARFDGFVSFAAVPWGSCNAGHSGAIDGGWGGGLAPVGAVMLPDIRPMVFCLLPLAAIVGWRAFRETRRIPAEGRGRAERFHGC